VIINLAGENMLVRAMDKKTQQLCSIAGFELTNNIRAH